MKRRPSSDLLTVPFAKRLLQSNIPEPINPLISVVEQYGLLEAVVSNLSADDLLALTLTCKTLYDIIASRPNCLKNLLGKLSCSGKGVSIRTKCHKNSPFFFAYDCTEYVQCGTKDRRRAVDTRPCSNCNVATCDECRIHCVYQSIYEASSDPTDLAELPNFSGFVLLEPSEQPILSPHHLLSDESASVERWKNPSKSNVGPYHDQGHLDVALEEDSTAPPESIKKLLDMNLGKESLTTLSNSSFYDSPSPVVRSLCRVTEARKVFLCDGCFDRDAPKGPESLHPPAKALPWLKQASTKISMGTCECTLRQRFLDRWLCVGCYQKEEETISQFTVSTPMEQTGLCRCGSDARHAVCLWCWGEVNDTTKIST